VYVHQFKINAKAACGGEVWAWHQDYVFWLKEDGMPAPRVTNVMVFLDEVNEFNGPLLLIPGSHREGVVDDEGRPAAASGEPAWMANVGAELKYSLKRERVAALARRSGIVAPKGKAGSVLFFDANVFHGSAPNMSPFGRAIVISTYNSVENRPMPRAEPRPEFLAGRDYAALVPVEDDALLPV
jgi:ectoine hydroxylase